MSIINELFGDFADSRLQRLRFIIYLGVTFFLIIIFSLIISALVLFLLNIDPFSLDDSLKDILALIISFVISFFTLNLQAKRFRDMGLPGWLMALLYFSISLMADFSDSYFSLLLYGLEFILILLLVFAPSDSFNTEASSY